MAHTPVGGQARLESGLPIPFQHGNDGSGSAQHVAHRAPHRAPPERLSESQHRASTSARIELGHHKPPLPRDPYTLAAYHELFKGYLIDIYI
jgi:hypothetical protein